jgi:hypothetical protein
MTSQPEMWSAMLKYLPTGTWIQLQEIYSVVEKTLALDDEDYEPQSPSSDLPKWKRNVRNILQYRKGTGEIEWDGNAGYRF